jgi:general secretion pathway protein D
MNLRTCALLLAALPLIAAAQDSKSADPPSNTYAVPSMELTELIARFARRTGRQFIVDPRVRAVVPLTGFGSDDVDLGRLLAILNAHDFVALDEGTHWTVVPDANARQLAGPVYHDLKFKAHGSEVVTVLLELQNACSAQLVPILRPLMPMPAHMAAEPRTNTMVLNDRAANIRRIGEMIERFDRNAPKGKKCEDWPPPPPAGAPAPSRPTS